MSIVRQIALRMPRLGPAERVSMGLISLVISSVLILDFAFGIFPDQLDSLRRERSRMSEQLAVQVATVLEAAGTAALTKTMAQWVAHDDEVSSLGVRRDDGQLVAQAGNHVGNWVEPDKGVSTLQHVRVPLFQGDSQWGYFEISFVSPGDGAGPWQWAKQPVVLVTLFLGIGGFVLFTLYLRRVFEYLDPQSVIPDRVRTAFDAFSEGVMVIDTAGRVILANSVIRKWFEQDGRGLIGNPVRKIGVLNAALPARSNDHPWMRAMAQGISIRNEYLEMNRPNGELIKTTVNCSPVQDADGKVRGCIVTFDDISETEKVNRQLVEAMEELEASRAETESRNRELHHLAMHDPLTGCLNRRAFFEAFGRMFSEIQQSGRLLTCIMVDVDHFKSFNDQYGHAVGDQVLKTVAQLLAGGVRGEDLLCRYGGEEFCIAMPDTDAVEAGRVAERLRCSIESQAAKSLRDVRGISITASFGIAQLAEHVYSENLLKEADVALYAAKEGGRNRVVTHVSDQEEMSPA